MADSRDLGGGITIVNGPPAGIILMQWHVRSHVLHLFLLPSQFLGLRSCGRGTGIDTARGHSSWNGETSTVILIAQWVSFVGGDSVRR